MVFSFFIRRACLRSPAGRSSRLLRTVVVSAADGVGSAAGGVGSVTGGGKSAVGGIDSVTGGGIGLTFGSDSEKPSESDGMEICLGFRAACFLRRGLSCISGKTGSSSSGSRV